MVGKMSNWGNVLSGKSPSGKCSVGELSGRGYVPRGNVSRGAVLGKVSVGELSGRGIVLQSLITTFPIFSLRSKLGIKSLSSLV